VMISNSSENLDYYLDKKNCKTDKLNVRSVRYMLMGVGFINQCYREEYALIRKIILEPCA
jgi:hypothetical protein